METLPWTVAAFQKRRRATWRAIRWWLLVLLVALIGFEIAVRLDGRGTMTASADGELADLTLGLTSLFVAFVAAGAITFAVRRYYRCPRCNEVPMGQWGAAGASSFGLHRGVAIFPSDCPKCGAQLSAGRN